MDKTKATYEKRPNQQILLRTLESKKNSKLQTQLGIRDLLCYLLSITYAVLTTWVKLSSFKVSR